MLQEGEERFPNYAEYLENAGNESDDDNKEHSSGGEDSSESSVVIGVNESSDNGSSPTDDSQTPLTMDAAAQDAVAAMFASEKDGEGAA